MMEKQWKFPGQGARHMDTWGGVLADNLPLRSPSVDWADRCMYECKECRPPETFDTHSKVRVVPMF